MQPTNLEIITGAEFRANPRYQLVMFDRLPLAYKESLANLQKDPDFYGVLMPYEQGGIGLKSVCRETALLFYTMQQEGNLPSYLYSSLGENLAQSITELVFDGIIEIKLNGEFVSGADAYAIMCKQKVSQGQGSISKLSTQALMYAQELEIDDALRLSTQLYFYNRIPVSSRWKKEFSSSQEILDKLGIGASGANKSLLDSHWTKVSLKPPYDSWLMWKSRHNHVIKNTQHGTFKLYISPLPEDICDVFSAVLQVLHKTGAYVFKIGKDAYGLLRPDKFVAYFDSYEQLEYAIEELKDKLHGYRAHGVPFTAEAACNGLLSWGIDPPRESKIFEWQENESWRLWATNKLAVALLTAKKSSSKSIQPWQFALERLGSIGVNTSSWTPDKDIWNKKIGKGE